MDARFSDALARLPDYFGNHVLVSVTALALGLALSMPLALASLRRPALRAALLAATSIVQTIPGLALLALFYPLLLAAAAWTGSNSYARSSLRTSPRTARSRARRGRRIRRRPSTVSTSIRRSPPIPASTAT